MMTVNEDNGDNDKGEERRRQHEKHTKGVIMLCDECEVELKFQLKRN